ncbi:MAG: glycosyltransferase family 4 protein [Bacteroidota bacterium]
MTDHPNPRSKIKVLHVITTFSLGGATENTLLSVEGLRDLGYDVSILTGPPNTSEGSLFERARRNGIRVVVIRDLQRSIHPFHDFLAFLKIWSYLRHDDYAIVHTHSSKAGFLGRLAARLAGVPVVTHTIHGLPFHEYQNPVLRSVFVLAEKIGMTLSNKVVAVTHTIVDKAIAAGVGKREKFVVVRSGFEMESFAVTPEQTAVVRSSLGLSRDDLVVGKIARFSKLKGHNYLLEAIPRVIEQVPNAKFLLVGSGELEAMVRTQVQQRGLSPYIVFAGLVEQEHIPAMISTMDVVVHTSLLEGLARVLPQALSMRKPVISFDIDGAHEVIASGTTGYLVSPGDSQQLAEKIIAVLKDVGRARKMGEAGYNMVAHDWTKRGMVEGIDRVYFAMLCESPKSERFRWAD